jgi:hypothetical protein
MRMSHKHCGEAVNTALEGVYKNEMAVTEIYLTF